MVRGEVEAAGHACGEQFVTWPQSQLERVLSAGCSAFHLLTGGGGLRPGLYPSARCRCSSGPHVEQRWSLVPRGCVPVSLHPRTAGHSWQSAGRAGAGLGSDPRCEMLWWALGTGLSLLSPSSPLYPPEKTSALHAALLPAHCASWQTHNLTFLGLI